MLKPAKNVVFIEEPDEDQLPRVKVKYIPENTESEYRPGDTVLIRDNSYESLCGIHFIVDVHNIVAIAYGEDAID